MSAVAVAAGQGGIKKSEYRFDDDYYEDYQDAKASDTTDTD